MSAPDPTAATICSPCGPSMRNRYFPGRRLSVADYQLEQRNLIERRRLINHAMLGEGVVEGMAVDPVMQDDEKNRGIVIGPGFALDRRGRELVACDPVTVLDRRDILWLDTQDGRLEAGNPPAEPVASEGIRDRDAGRGCRHYLLRAHYAERPVDSISIDDGCEPPRCEATHICETVVYSLTPVRHRPPGLASCPCNLWPDKECAPAENRWSGTPDGLGDPTVADLHDRGPHAQLAQWGLDRVDNGLCHVDGLDRVGPLLVALDDGIPLACVDIAFDCGKPHVARVVDASPRRLAYPNPVLFDLVRGCDLTRIQNVGWAEWLSHDQREVSFRAFARKFIPPNQLFTGKTKRAPRDPIATSFWICFSGPVQVESLTPDIVAFTLVQRDENEDVGEVRRIPVRAIDVADTTAGDPPGTTRACRPRVSFRFWNGEINPDNSSGFEEQTLVEIEVRTAFIVDAGGQKVAGGGRSVPSDDCVPGGRFLSSFVVRPAEDEPDTGEPGTDQPDDAKQDDTSQPAAVPPAQGGLK